MTVDEFVETQILAEFRDAVEMLRALMRECAPDATEVFSYGMPTWTGRNVIAWLIPTTKDLTFGFTHGVEFEDRYRLLRGVGKWARHMKIKDVSTTNMDALRYYIAQALKFDAR